MGGDQRCDPKRPPLLNEVTCPVRRVEAGVANGRGVADVVQPWRCEQDVLVFAQGGGELGGTGNADGVLPPLRKIGEQVLGKPPSPHQLG
jgi:hypothetical protein